MMSEGTVMDDVGRGIVPQSLTDTGGCAWNGIDMKKC